MPEISVIFPMYNVEKYLENSLRSVLAQTYRDFELVAVNDGSTDNTMEVFRRVVSEYGNDTQIKLIEKENGGLADARNTALAAASGNRIAFVDSDDLIHPKYLQTLIEDAVRYDTDVSFSSFQYVNENTLFDYKETVQGEPIEREALMKLLLPRKKFLTACWCMLVKKSLLDSNGLYFNPKVKFSVDRAYIWKIIDLSESITINQSQLYHYYTREGSIMTATKKENLLSGVENFCTEIRSLEHLPFDNEILISRWELGVLHSVAKLLPYGEYKDLRKKMGFFYRRAFRIPTARAKLFSLAGMISEKLLYRVFVKY